MWNSTTAFNALPALPPKGFSQSKAILFRLINARVALVQLNQALRYIPDKAMLVTVLSGLEAKYSCEIENIYTPTPQLFKTPVVGKSRDTAVAALLHNRQALIRFVRQEVPPAVSVETFCEIGSVIQNTPIQVRTRPGTYIGNARTGRVIYTPPVGANVILDKLNQLADFINRDIELNSREILDPLVQMAMAHYQFEAIHPFSDGNGRTGRVLNILFLKQKGLLDYPVLYLSKYIVENKNTYYQSLLNVTRDQAWDDWIAFMLDAIEHSAQWTLAKVNAIIALRDALITYMRNDPTLTKIYSRELVDLLFTRPYCRVSTLVNNNLCQRQTAMKYLNVMTDFGIVKKSQENSEYLFCNHRLMHLLSNDENHWRDFS